MAIRLGYFGNSYGQIVEDLFTGNFSEEHFVFGIGLEIFKKKQFRGFEPRKKISLRNVAGD